MRVANHWKIPGFLLIAFFLSWLGASPAQAQQQFKSISNQLPVMMVVNVTNPQPGSEVSGSVVLQATTSLAASSLEFTLTASNLNLAPFTIVGVSNDQLNWEGQVPWDTRQYGNGSVFSISATVLDEAGAPTNSRPLNVTVNNPAYTVTVTAPAAGAVSGSVTLRAVTSEIVDSLQFRLIRPDGSRAIISGTSADKLNWTSANPWDTTKAANGAGFEIFADALVGQVQTSSLTPVQVTVQNEVQYTVTVTAPAAGAVSGSVTLRAVTSEIVDSLQFRLIRPDGSSATISGTTADRLSWISANPWDTTKAANGAVFEIFADAFVREVKTSSLTPVQVTVQNEVQYTVTMTAPVNNSTVNPGGVRLVATTSDIVDGLQFIFSSNSPNFAAIEPIRAESADKKTWTASWSNNQPDGTVVDIGARAALGRQTRESASVRVTVVVPATPTLTLTAPTGGAAVSGQVSFVANSSQVVDSLSFFVLPSGQQGVQPQVYNAASRDKQAWISSSTWDTTRLANGTAYDIYAQTVWNDQTIQSRKITVTVQNEVQYTVTMTAPAADSTVKPGAVRLVATTSDIVDGLQFIFSSDSPNFAATEPIRAESADKKIWSAGWSNIQPEGTIVRILARATLNQQTKDSASVSVKVAALDYTVVMVAPRDNSAVPPGNVTLSAVTGVAVDGLEFVLSSPTPNTAVPRPIQASSQDKKQWSATWSADYPDDTVFSVIARATLAQKTKDSLSATFLFRKTAEMPLTVVITLPPVGAKLQQVTTLTATTSRKADALSFRIGGTGLADRTISVNAQPDAAGIIWTAAWDTLTVPNGDYRMAARAVSGRQAVDSAPVDIVVTNETPKEPPPSLTVAIDAPPPGSTLAGRTRLAASVSQKVDLLTFFINPVQSTEAAPLIVRAGGDPEGMKWIAEWDTLQSANGGYNVVAKVILGGRWAGESAPLDVKVDNQAPVEEEKPPLPPVEEEKPPLPPVEEEKPPLPPPVSIKVLRPTGFVRGNVVMTAAASGGRVAKVVFRAGSADGTGAKQEKAAVFSRDTGLWQALWDTTAVPDGRYHLSVSADMIDGTPIAGEPVIVTVANTRTPLTAETPAITVIPPEVIKEEMRQLPTGTRLLPVEKLRVVDTEQVGKELDKECADARIPAERCQNWLSRRHRADDCRRVGILSKEECVAYLQQKYGGQLPACIGKSDEDCAAELSKKTINLMPVEDLDRLRQSVAPYVGQVVRFSRPQPQKEPAVPDEAAPPAEMPAKPEPPPSAIEQIMADNIPLRAEKVVALRVQASPEYAKATDEDSFKAVPAVLMIDSDDDGLPDDVEKRLGTDPRQADSDDDGYSDSEELKNGYNPLGPGKLSEARVRLAPVDIAIVSGAPIEQPRSGSETDPQMAVDKAESVDDEQGPVVHLAGKAEPGETVTLFIYSYLPVVLTTTADADGNWSYELDSSLTDGEHEAYVVVTDETGKIKKKSSPLSFFVAEAQAVTEEDFFKPMSAVEQVEAPVNRLIYWYVGGAVVLVAIALIVGAMIFFRPARKRDQWS